MLICGMFAFGLGLLTFADLGGIESTPNTEASEITTRQTDCRDNGHETLSNCQGHCQYCKGRFCYHIYKNYTTGVDYHSCRACSDAKQAPMNACEVYCSNQKCKNANYSCQKDKNADTYSCITPP